MLINRLLIWAGCLYKESVHYFFLELQVNLLEIFWIGNIFEPWTFHVFRCWKSKTLLANKFSMHHICFQIKFSFQYVALEWVGFAWDFLNMGVFLLSVRWVLGSWQMRGKGQSWLLKNCCACQFSMKEANKKNVPISFYTEILAMETECF